MGTKIQGIMVMAIGMIFAGIGITFFPIVLEGAEEARTADNITEYTGTLNLVELYPTVVLLGFIVGGVLASFLGFQMVRRG